MQFLTWIIIKIISYGAILLRFICGNNTYLNTLDSILCVLLICTFIDEIFNDLCNVNTLDDLCNVNTLDDLCYVNTLDDLCNVNTLDDLCNVNTLDDLCNVNTLDDLCNVNTLDDLCNVVGFIVAFVVSPLFHHQKSCLFWHQSMCSTMFPIFITQSSITVATIYNLNVGMQT